MKVANSLLTLRFRRLRFIASGVRDFFEQRKSDRPAAYGQSDSGSLIVNASRIAIVGGLRNFSLDVLDCLASIYPATEVLLPQGTPPPVGLKVHWLPEWLGSSSRVSRLKPLLWLLYSGLFFPGKRSRPILSTTHQLIPFRSRQIVTIHDMRPYFLPDTWMQKFYFHFMLPRTLHRCDGILTVSNATKKDIVSIYKIPGENIHIVPNVVSPCGFNQELQAASTLQEPYLLMVGASLPHKNAVEVITRHELWEKKYRLKILAGIGQYRDLLLNLASKLGVAEKIDFLPNVTDSDLHMLYRDCAALIYPSVMEGFGLPPLEAMSFGKVVIVSDIPVFRELLGEVPLYVQLGDGPSWENAFRQLSQIETNGENERCRAGRSLAGQFSKQRMTDALQKSLSAIWGFPASTDPLP